MGKVIVFASPVFFALIALEWWWARRSGRAVFGLSDSIASLSLGIMSQVTAVFTRVLRVSIYAAVLFFIWPQDSELRLQLREFWLSPIGWAAALIFYDFCYYWLHRWGHTVAIFWAAHAVHHQSPRYNLTTALRQTSSGALIGWVAYLPMAIAGVPLKVFAIVALIDLLYQFWVHTELVGKLGWFDRWFCAPSNHRVHHAVNDVYLDKNYGGIWMAWDRIFGSYAEERDDTPCVYGTRKPLYSLNPVWANLEVYAALWRLAGQCSSWRDKLLLWIKPPGWQPPSAPKLPVFDMAEARALPQALPQLSKRDAWIACITFALWLQLSTPVLFYWGTWPFVATAAGSVAVCAGLLGVAAFAQSRLSRGAALGLHVAIVAGLVVAYALSGVSFAQMFLAM